MKVKIENVSGEEIEIDVGPIQGKNHAWEDKYITKSCSQCQAYIDREAAIDLIKIVKRNQKNGWVSPSKERILGICLLGSWPKILVPTRTRSITELKRCRDLQQGRNN